MITLLWVVGGLAALIALHLLVVALVPGFPRPVHELTSGIAPDHPSRVAGLQWEEAGFAVEGSLVKAWLLLPQGREGKAPCVVMGHGFGGTKDMGLLKYACPFVEAGMAVLLFDYRFFGESEGRPRQLAWVPHQLADWSAAIAYARSRPEIDPVRIALWGASFSGGHVLMCAARDSRIACISALCPGLDGRASARAMFKQAGGKTVFRMVLHGQRDLVRSWLRLSAHRVPIVAPLGQVACLGAPGAYEGYAGIVPQGFVNQVCARILLRGDHYRPVTQAHKVSCPVQLLFAEKDNLTPAGPVEETAAALGELAELMKFPIGHFDIYQGQWFEKTLAAQVEFFKKHLAV